MYSRTSSDESWVDGEKKEKTMDSADFHFLDKEES